MLLRFTNVTLFFILFFLSGLALHAQTFNWVTGGGTTASDADLVNHPEGVDNVCTDANGNVYALSHVAFYTVYADTFSGSGDFEDFNLLITSYNCEGQMRWAKLITSTNGGCYGFGIAADSSGHIYIGGTFPNSVLKIGYDTVINTYEYLQLGVIKFDTTGHFDWIRQVGLNTPANLSATTVDIGSIALDKSDNIHLITGLYSGAVFMAGDTSHYGNYDIKYSPSGVLLSARRLSLDSTVYMSGATIDKQSNTLYAWGYRAPAFCSCGAGDSSAYNFIAAFDTSGNRKWVDTMGNIYSDEQGLIQDVTVDGAGHIYLCGSAYGYIIYEGDTTYPPAGAYNNIAFIIKADTSGNFKWASQCDGNSNPALGTITMMPNNKIAAIGSFSELIKKGSITLNSIDVGADPFFYIVDTNGNMLALQSIHGDGDDDCGLALASDKVGNLYMGGQVSDSIAVDCCGGITPYVSVGGNTDFFVAKYGVDCSCTSMPVAAYTTTGTSTVNMSYTGTTTGLDSVVWNFGDEATASGTTATHTYTVVGSVDLCVTVYTSCGSDIHCSDILVNCGTITSSFTDTGTTVRGFTYTGTTGTPDTITWNFGDGHTATGTTAIHTYSASGTYTVCATVATACGSNTACNTIVINCTPTSLFTSTGTTTRDFTYTGTTISLDSVKWNFGDGYTASGTTATHTYSASGTYTVCATVFTACGSNTSCNTIVIDCSPVSSFTYSGTDPVSFTYTGTTAGLDSVVWNFGDGHTGLGTTAEHTYSASGTYTVCATVYATCGTNAACNVVVIDCTPASSFTYSGTDPVSFTYTGTTIGLDSVVWSFGDGHTASGTTTSHTYSVSGTYTVCAKAYAVCGINTSCNTIVIDCTPASSFTYSGISPTDFTYTGSTFGLDSVVWSFGDGTSGAGTSTAHTYTASGTYSVCATAYALCGTNTSCSLITIDCSPTASYSVTGFITKDFTYTGATAGLDSVAWNFGDTSGSTTGTSATHTYTATGTYTVCVTAYTSCGDNTFCHTIIINCVAPPVAAFIDTGSNPRFFGYIGTTAGYDSLVWTFGDGTSYSGVGTAFTTTHTYTDSGTFEACVTVYTSCGSDSSCKDIMVNDVGVPILSVSNIQVYPNPAGDELNITGILDNTNYRLLSVTGACLEEGILRQGSNIVSMKNFASGIYILEMASEDGERNNVRVIKE